MFGEKILREVQHIEQVSLELVRQLRLLRHGGRGPLGLECRSVVKKSRRL